MRAADISSWATFLVLFGTANAGAVLEERADCVDTPAVQSLSNVLKSPRPWCSSYLNNHVSTKFENMKPTAISTACKCITKQPLFIETKTRTVTDISVSTITKIVSRTATVINATTVTVTASVTRNATTPACTMSAGSASLPRSSGSQTVPMQSKTFSNQAMGSSIHTSVGSALSTRTASTITLATGSTTAIATTTSSATTAASCTSQSMSGTPCSAGATPTAHYIQLTNSNTSADGTFMTSSDGTPGWLYFICTSETYYVPLKVNLNSTTGRMSMATEDDYWLGPDSDDDDDRYGLLYFAAGSNFGEKVRDPMPYTTCFPDSNGVLSCGAVMNSTFTSTSVWFTVADYYEPHRLEPRMNPTVDDRYPSVQGTLSLVGYC